MPESASKSVRKQSSSPVIKAARLTIADAGRAEKLPVLANGIIDPGIKTATKLKGVRRASN